MTTQPKLIRAKDVASMYGTTLARLRSAEKQRGFPPGVKFGSATSTRFYDREAVDSWYKTHAQTPDPK